jgi:asparagine synthase (glutamine-hydrolysing)
LTGRDSARAVERIRSAYDRLQCANRRHSVERMMSIDLRMNLADDLLLYTDKITMHHSLECRVPLLDLPLVAFVESLPARFRTGLFRGKVLHRKYAERMLPPAIVHRKKKGFLSPTKEWFRQGAVRDILLNPRSYFASCFDLGEVRRILADHAAGLNQERQIFLLLSLHHWMTANLAAKPSAVAAR